MLMSRRPDHLLTHTAAALLLLLLLIVFVFVFAATPCLAVMRQFSTVAISQGPNAMLVCVLVIDQGATDNAYYSGGGNAKLHCISLPDGELISYPFANVPYSAISAGKDFLCGLMALTDGHAAMRWWYFSEEAAANRSCPISRRLYWGPSLRALSAGGLHSCGLSDDHHPCCWEWPQLNLPKGLDFSRIALSHDFLYGIVKVNGTTMRYYGGLMDATDGAAAFKSIAVGRRHACAVDAKGGLICWGDGNPTVTFGDLPADMTAMALGHNTTCILTENGMVRCWGVKVPKQYAHTTFVAIEVDGDSVCAVMTSTYSVVCWGNDGRFVGRNLVFNDTMPGAYEPKWTCQCDVVSSSGTLCSNGSGRAVTSSPCEQPGQNGLLRPAKMAK